jgi:hypothetical protein
VTSPPSGRGNESSPKPADDTHYDALIWEEAPGIGGHRDGPTAIDDQFDLHDSLQVLVVSQRILVTTAEETEAAPANALDGFGG